MNPSTTLPTKPLPLKLFFPQLPPELRNEIYAHTSTPSPTNPPTTATLLFTKKTYTLPHSTLEITPLHHGSLPFLSVLRAASFLEAREYHSHLLHSSLTIHIGILFTGRVEHFSQPHWAAKVSAHLRKLVKRYPWVATAGRWDVRVVWDAQVGPWKAGRPAEIVRGMVETVLGGMDRRVKGWRGEVRVRWCVPRCYGVQREMEGLEFGFVGLLEGAREVGVRRAEWEVVRGGGRKVESEVLGDGRFRAVPTGEKGKRVILVGDNGEVEWSEEAQGETVVRKVVDGGKSWLQSFSYEGSKWDWEHFFTERERRVLGAEGASKD